MKQIIIITAIILSGCLVNQEETVVEGGTGTRGNKRIFHTPTSQAYIVPDGEWDFKIKALGKVVLVSDTQIVASDGVVIHYEYEKISPWIRHNRDDNVYKIPEGRPRIRIKIDPIIVWIYPDKIWSTSHIDVIFR